MLRPTNDLVGVAWVKTISDTSVATTLPDNSSWGASGFTQLQVVGGSPDLYVPIASPVFEVTCWAAPATAGSSKPPWNMANARAEVIRTATYGGVNVTVTGLGDAYDDARVLQAAFLTEPRKVRGDRADYAGYTFDLQVWWVVSA